MQEALVQLLSDIERHSQLLTRRISKRRTLGPLDAAEQRGIFARRLAAEDSRAQARVNENALVGQATSIPSWAF